MSFVLLVFFFILDLWPFVRLIKLSGFPVGAEVNVFSSLMFSRVHLDHFFLARAYIFFSSRDMCNKNTHQGPISTETFAKEMDIQSFQCTLCYISDSLAQFLILEIILFWFSDLYRPLYCIRKSTDL